MKNVMPSEENLDIIFLIDKSGSMYGSQKDTVGGFNSFIDKEREKEFNTTVTTIFFNHGYEVVYKRKSIYDIGRLTEDEYRVGGSTALLDAIGKTIVSMEREIDNKVLFVIITDGLENASREFSKTQIRNMINNHKWEFIFLGADIDSYSEARSIGIRKSHVANYKKSAESFNEVFDSVSDVSFNVRANQRIDDCEWKKRLDKYD